MVMDALDADNPVSFNNDDLNVGTAASSAVLANVICEVGKFGLTFLRWLQFCGTAGGRG